LPPSSIVFVINLHRYSSCFDLSLRVDDAAADFSVERDYLLQIIVPGLKTFAAKLGVTFDVSTLRYCPPAPRCLCHVCLTGMDRWGVTAAIFDRHATVEVCLREIARCNAASHNNFFVALLGDKYGYCPLPRSIPALEFQSIMRLVSRASSELGLLLSDVYQLDENMLQPEYALLPLATLPAGHKQAVQCSSASPCRGLMPVAVAVV